MTEQDQFLAFIARLCLVLLFPFSALNKLFDYPAAMAQAAHGWIPLPPSAAAVLLVLGGTLEVVGLGRDRVAAVLGERDRVPAAQLVVVELQQVLDGGPARAIRRAQCDDPRPVHQRPACALTANDSTTPANTAAPTQ